MKHPQEASVIQPRCLFAAPLVFSFLCFVEVPADPTFLDGSLISPLAFLTAYLAGAILACAILVGYRPLRAMPFLTLSPYVCALPLIAGFALAFSYHAAGFGSPVQIPVGAALIGVGSALLLAQWAEAFARIDSHKLLPTVCAMLALAFLLKTMFLPFSLSPLNLAIIGSLMLIGIIPLAQAVGNGVQGHRQAPREADATSPLSRPSWHYTVAGCVLCSLVWGFTWGNTITGTELPYAGTMSPLSLDISKAITAVAIGLIGLRAGERVVEPFAPALGAAMLLLGWMLARADLPWSGVSSYLFTGIGFSLFQIALWTSACRIAPANPAKTRTLFCLARVLLGIVLLAGIGVAPLLPAALREMFTPICCVAFFAILAIAPPLRAKGIGSGTSPHEEPAVANRAETATECYGLSPREQEVFVLFAQGYSANHIADNLTVSPHTVKTHIKRIYAKLGVHSKDELIARFNIGEDQR